MTRALTIVMPFYKNGGMLKVHQAAWARYPDAIRERMTVIIVDDGSPTNAAIDAVTPGFDYDLQIYRVLIDKPWNQNGARNLGMHVAPEGWILSTDFDHLLEPNQAEQLLATKVRTGNYYIPRRRIMPTGETYKPHPNSYYLERSMYWAVGGMDEDFCGWYGSDSTFRRGISEYGRRVELKNVSLLLHGRDTIPDASTTDFGRKGTEYHSANNPDLIAKRKKGHYRPTNPIRFPWERVL